MNFKFFFSDLLHLQYSLHFQPPKEGEDALDALIV